MAWVQWAAWATVFMNAVMILHHVLALVRLRRLNATLLALCLNTYALRHWPIAHRMGGVLGFRVEVHPMTQEDAQRSSGSVR